MSGGDMAWHAFVLIWNQGLYIVLYTNEQISHMHLVVAHSLHIEAYWTITRIQMKDKFSECCLLIVILSN